MKIFGNYTVYKHTFPNNKVYIGITNQDPERRWRSDGSGYKQGAIHFAIKKYGWENVKHEVLFTGLTKEEAEAKEIELIALYHSTNPAFGYNRTNGGDSGNCNITNETRMKLRSIHLGKPLSDEHKKKIGLANKGHKMSEEQKVKLSAAGKGRRLSSDTKEKIRKSLSKRTAQIDNNGNVLQIFKSTKEAFEMTGIRHIIEVCNGKRKTAGGFHWKYTESEVW